MKELHQLIELASSFVEQYFAIHGKIAPMWHAITGDGTHRLYTMPPTDKDIAVAIMREQFAQSNVVRCLFIDEAWSVNAADEKAKAKAMAWLTAGHLLKDYPGRIEIITFSAEDRDGMMLCADRQITRKVNSKPRLGPLIIHDDLKQYEGRFVGMLKPMRRSN